MSKRHGRPRKRYDAFEGYMYRSALSAAAHHINRIEFPMVQLCSAVLAQTEQDWHSAAAARDRVELNKLRHEITYSGGLISSILDACDCEPELFIAKLEREYPLGCQKPTHRKKAKSVEL